MNIAKEYNLAKDLYQEMIIVLLDYKDETIIELHEKKQLKFFVSRIMSNMFYNKKSPFYKKHIESEVECYTVELPTHIPQPLQRLMDIPLEKLMDEGNEEFVLLRLSLEQGGIVEVAKQTNIKRISVQAAVIRAKNKLKQIYGKV